MVAFLFGAGAERPCFELPTGTEFLEKTLYQDQEKSGDKFRKVLKGFFTGKYFDYYKYTAHRINTDIYKFMLEKIIRNNMVFLRDVGSAGLLGSYFYTIINPPKYSKINFSKIDTFTRILYLYKPKILSSYNDSYYAYIKKFERQRR